MTTLPSGTDFTGGSVTEGNYKTAISTLRTFIADLLGIDSADKEAARAALGVLEEGPSFSVHRNGTDQLNITSISKLKFTIEEFDTNNDFEIDADDSGGATESRFTPTVAGKYLLSVNVQWFIAATSGVRILYLYKNGSEYKNTKIVNDADYNLRAHSLTVVVDANGSSDYFEIFLQDTGQDTSDVEGNATDTYWTGCRIG